MGKNLSQVSHEKSREMRSRLLFSVLPKQMMIDVTRRSFYDWKRTIFFINPKSQILTITAQWTPWKQRLSKMIPSLTRRCLNHRANSRLNLLGRSKASARFISSCDLKVELKNDKSDFEKRPSKENLQFGRTFTDHMLAIEWDKESGWNAPKILPYQDLKINPAATSLHYGLQCFEGMKAYRSVDDPDSIHLFRPDKNMEVRQIHVSWMDWTKTIILIVIDHHS